MRDKLQSENADCSSKVTDSEATLLLSGSG